MAHAIDCNSLEVRYRAKNGRWVEAVSGLTLHVEPGEVVGFLGPNGAGKSSTIKALMGFVEPSGGDCSIFGKPAGSVEARRRIGYLPEVAMYYPFLTPMETLVLYGELQGLSGRKLREEAGHLLEIVGLKGAEGKQNRSLSKGMLQRVGIAQSLLGSPELLILDEVTSGLDPVGRKELRELLKDRQRSGATLFFSSHELSEVAMICDRILLIHKGRLIEERNLTELQESLRQYTVTFAGVAQMMDLTQHFEEDHGMITASFADKSSLLQAIERIQREDGKIFDIVAQEGSLEDYFIDTITKVDRQAVAA
jgi:ABC-2 type transport system ATP-binding protein